MVKHHVAHVQMSRPDKHNGLDKDMMVELVHAAKTIRKNRAIRAVVLSGEGASFCAGLDFSYVAKNPGFIPPFFMKLPWRQENMFQRVGFCWRQIPVPVIAAIHGNCFGGGMQIALGCDFRFATPDAKLSIMEMKWGLIPDMSGTVQLSRLLPLDQAQLLTMTGKVIRGDEAQSIGLVTETKEDPIESAFELAHELATKSPDAISATKVLFRKVWKKDSRAALFWERWIQLKLLGRKNQRIAMRNGMKSENKPFLNRRIY
jgi:enoyl-CoA hydratase/carnithine racemase